MKSQLRNAISLVILSFNRRDEIEHTLPYLCYLREEHGFELIVVDNASSDGSREFLLSLAPRFPSMRLILNSSNLGVASGRNAGWRLAQREYILQLDDDLRIELMDLQKLCEVMDSNPGAGVLSPKIVHAQTGISECDHGNSECEVANFHGACHLVRRVVFQQVGEIDPLCAFGGEELDYSVRVRDSGFTVMYTPGVTVKHNSQIKKGHEGEWRRRMWVYNYTRVNFKHFPFNIAALFAFRYCVSHMISAVIHLGIQFASSLPWYALQGARDGRRHHLDISNDTCRFYINPQLRPEFGNVPIWRKLLLALASWST